MELWEILTGSIGESYERAYAWACSEHAARVGFEWKHPGKPVARMRRLFTVDAEPFVTQLSDSGFEDRDYP